MVVLVLSMLGFAQDIIITRDAKRIESKIQEVSLTEVRYQTWDNLDGPVFVLPTSEISVITFQNGTVKVFDSAKSSIVNEIGFEYPQYFTRLFKAKTGQTPVEYRTANNG